MDTQGKREARPGPTWLLTKRTIQVSSSLDSTDTRLPSWRQLETVRRAGLRWAPGLGRKGTSQESLSPLGQLSPSTARWGVAPRGARPLSSPRDHSQPVQRW